VGINRERQSALEKDMSAEPKGKSQVDSRVSGVSTSRVKL
jgi:hypothetical protein